ncbi:MAG TPA: glycoside hydrolase family 13 protein [Candidatus Acidoferrum sp.]|nr:glycoside hydrolase family 13 protein [Candidatus Acidoferrum sp.]
MPPEPIDTPAWVRDAVFYQVFPDRFARSARLTAPGPFQPWEAPPTYHGFKGGDLYGVADRLPELADLGVTALYLTPIFTSASNHRYHTDDYRAVDPLLGGDAALRELLDNAHDRGMRVILDGVFNHCGRGFEPFHHVVENGADSPYRDWFYLDPAVLAGQRGLDAYPDRTGMPPTPESLGYKAWWGLPALPKLAVETAAVREYLLETAEHWLRFGADGWRLDVPAEIDDEAFWQEFRRRCRAVDPQAYLVGEIWNEAPEWLRGDRFDALMNYPLGAAILGFAAGGKFDRTVIEAHGTYRETLHLLDGPAFGQRLDHLMTVYDPAVTAVQLNLLGSHDAPRALTVLARDKAAMRIAVLLQFTLPGAPCIYYGDEIAMEGAGDPDCRRAFPVDPKAGDQDMRAFVKAVIAARRENRALRTGTVTVLAATRSAVALLRQADGQRALVVVNAGRQAESIAVELPGPGWGRFRALALPGWRSPSSDDPSSANPGAPARLSLTLPPQVGLVLLEDATSPSTRP